MRLTDGVNDAPDAAATEIYAAGDHYVLKRPGWPLVHSAPPPLETILDQASFAMPPCADLAARLHAAGLSDEPKGVSPGPPTRKSRSDWGNFWRRVFDWPPTAAYVAWCTDSLALRHALLAVARYYGFRLDRLPPLPSPQDVLAAAPDEIDYLFQLFAEAMRPTIAAHEIPGVASNQEVGVTVHLSCAQKHARSFEGLASGDSYCEVFVSIALIDADHVAQLHHHVPLIAWRRCTRGAQLLEQDCAARLPMRAASRGYMPFARRGPADFVEQGFAQALSEPRPYAPVAAPPMSND